MKHLAHSPIFALQGFTGSLDGNTFGPAMNEFACHSWVALSILAGRRHWDAFWPTLSDHTFGAFSTLDRST